MTQNHSHRKVAKDAKNIKIFFSLCVLRDFAVKGFSSPYFFFPAG